MTTATQDGLAALGRRGRGAHRAPRRAHRAPRRLAGTGRRAGAGADGVRSGLGAAIASTAGFNIAATGAAGVGGVVLARALGPAVRGEYAAIMAWFGVLAMVGGMGQPAALCFYVAQYPRRARNYVASSRTLMLVTGVVSIIGGLGLATLLGHGERAFVEGYRLAFATSIVAFVAAAYTYSLQARDLGRWNQVRTAQPVAALIAVVVLWRLGCLSLDTAMYVLAGSMLLQLVWAYHCCRQAGLAPGRTRARLLRPLTVYGAAQIAALAPSTLNMQLDQIVLSQTVALAQLGQYAIAVSLSLLPLPLVSAIGYVTFPRLAAQRTVSGDARQLQRMAVLSSAAVGLAVLVPLGVVAYWLVPLVFGAAYAGAVPLLWILMPGSVFLTSGQVVGDLLRGRNRPVVVAWAEGFAAVFTVVLLLVLLPVVGVYGAAIASTVAYGISLAVMLRVLWRLPQGGSTDGTEIPTASELLAAV